MSIRPRYSLLTLLLLTALIAGGVRLWRGPELHRRSVQNLDYFYTRDWRGKEIVQGPMIVRSHKLDGSFTRFDVLYYRQGDLLWQSRCIIWPVKAPPPFEFQLSERSLADSSLNAAEQVDFQAAYDREQQKLPPLEPGYELLKTQGWRRTP